MRKARVKAIKQQEFAKPEGTTHSDIRRARRAHSNGLNRVPQPKPASPVGHPGFPTNSVQTIKTWAEKQPRIADVTYKKIEIGKGKNKHVVTEKTFHNKRKMVTRVVSKKAK